MDGVALKLINEDFDPFAGAIFVFVVVANIRLVVVGRSYK